VSMLYSDEQRAIAEEASKILSQRSDRSALLGYLERTGQWDEGLWALAREQGWCAIGIPEGDGGIGLGLTEQGLIAQAWGAQSAGCPFLAPHAGVAAALLASGFNGRDQWLPRLAAGEVVAATAFAEGNSPLPPAPRASFAEGKLSGTKTAVTGGLQADLAVVWASAHDGPVLVLAELAGVERAAVDSFDNSRLYAHLTFADTPAQVLASGEAAQTLARDVLALMAVVTAHEQVGGAEALLFTARDYALTRKAFGQPIGAFQSVKHRIAEMYGLVEIARANCIHAVASEGRENFLVAAADARLAATEAYDTCARDCIQVHGGIGVTWEAGIHLHMRRARSLAIEQGNMLFWEDLLVEQLTGVAA
jgi:acyl-CoA dehydrogenase